MNNAAAITAVQRALARFRRRQAHTPTNHSAREIAQMSMLAEFLYEAHTHDVDHFIDHNSLHFYDSDPIAAAA
jgi:hypothetical protein